MSVKNSKVYDVIVIGGGHAGCEAALAAARYGAETLLLTINMDHIAQMSCNPAIGGIAKGQVVREIDALGGAMARVADAATIQFRMLNSKKGPAVWSPRSQCDKVCYQKAYKRELEVFNNIDIKQGFAEKFVFDDSAIVGIETNFGDIFRSQAWVVATGTFLQGKLHYGLLNFPGGRAGDPPSDKLSLALKHQLNLNIGRLKTGTPPRVLAKTIDFSRMQKQDAEDYDEYFSYFPETRAFPQALRKDMPCYLVYSNSRTAEIVRQNIHKSPLYQGVIEGIGTRYCPSFEDKIIKFPHHEKHLLFLEPEGEFTEEYYLNGISSSLPPEVQIQMLHSIQGLENAEISRYAYAIEYDFVFPNQIDRSLRLKAWPNVFLAGQINGTSGYEEAGGQGLMAGLNAAKTAAGHESVELSRDSSYIGVMIDDLVTKEILEPYRLFTSRAEYRLRLRQDNADIRLCNLAFENGILPAEKHQKHRLYAKKLEENIHIAKSQNHQGKKLWDFLKTFQGISPDIAAIPKDILELTDDVCVNKRIINQMIILAHYEGYLSREEKSIDKLQQLENWKIPADFSYEAIKGLKNESRSKLQNVRPGSLAQASRIDGVTPAEVALLQVFLKRSKSQQ